MKGPALWGSTRKRIDAMNMLSRFNRSHKKRPAIPADLWEDIQAEADEEGIPADKLMRRLLDAQVNARRAADSLPERWERLTSREQQVVMLVCEKLSNDEIAGKLGISPETVKSHLRRAKGKLGLHTRRQIQKALERFDFGWDWG